MSGPDEKPRGFKKSNRPPVDDEALRDDVRSLEEMVRDISYKVNHAAVLNGGFNDLRNEVSEIRLAQKHIEATLPELKEDVGAIRTSIYNPKDGLYAKLRESNIEGMKREAVLYEMERKLSTKMESIEKSIDPIENTNKLLVRTAGEDLEELAAIVKTRKTIERIQWILVTALAGAGAKFLWDYLSANM